MNAHSLTLQGVARALGGKVVNDQVKAPGPNHSDADDSMCIKLDHGAPDGFVVHSFAGDDPIACKDYIRTKLGLTFEPRRQGEASVERMAARAQSRARVVAEYIYHDEQGQPSRKVQRTDPKGAFPQYRWDGSNWQAGVKGVPLYPYRLPDILKAIHDTIFICEGEKDADRLASLRGAPCLPVIKGAILRRGMKLHIDRRIWLGIQHFRKEMQIIRRLRADRDARRRSRLA